MSEKTVLLSKSRIFFDKSQNLISFLNSSFKATPKKVVCHFCTTNIGLVTTSWNESWNTKTFLFLIQFLTSNELYLFFEWSGSCCSISLSIARQRLFDFFFLILILSLNERARDSFIHIFSFSHRLCCLSVFEQCLRTNIQSTLSCWVPIDFAVSLPLSSACVQI